MKAEVKYERRAAEIDHVREMRKIERERIDDRLEADKRKWEKSEKEERQRLEADRSKAEAALEDKAGEDARQG